MASVLCKEVTNQFKTFLQKNGAYIQGDTISPNFYGSRGSRTPKKGGKGGAERGLYIIIFLFVMTIYSAKSSLIASFF